MPVALFVKDDVGVGVGIDTDTLCCGSRWPRLVLVDSSLAMGFGYKLNSINTGLFSITKES